MLPSQINFQLRGAAMIAGNGFNPVLVWTDWRVDISVCHGGRATALPSAHWVEAWQEVHTLPNSYQTPANGLKLH